MDKPVSGRRREHALRGFSESDADPDPIQQFDKWYDEAVKAGLFDPSVMALATAGADGQPAVRLVLLKGFGARGFVFYTNYESRKGRELAANPRVAVSFCWGDLDRQVRIEGAVEQLGPAESDAYFQSRPRESQLGAWASQQSAVIPDRETLEERYRSAAARFANASVPRPPNWGGYRILPAMIEFWQGRVRRLHDRLRYTRRADGTWLLERLSP